MENALKIDLLRICRSRIPERLLVFAVDILEKASTINKDLRVPNEIHVFTDRHHPLKHQNLIVRWNSNKDSAARVCLEVCDDSTETCVTFRRDLRAQRHEYFYDLPAYLVKCLHELDHGTTFFMSGRAPMNFIESCVAGKSKLEDIDDWIDRWHESPCLRTAFPNLHDYLGMTWPQYACWVKDPTCLALMCEPL
jgi:hypothetical protein